MSVLFGLPQEVITCIGTFCDEPSLVSWVHASSSSTKLCALLYADTIDLPCLPTSVRPPSLFVPSFFPLVLYEGVRNSELSLHSLYPAPSLLPLSSSSSSSPSSSSSCSSSFFLFLFLFLFPLLLPPTLSPSLPPISADFFVIGERERH
jgi:hypothetical protein